MSDSTHDSKTMAAAWRRHQGKPVIGHAERIDQQVKEFGYGHGRSATRKSFKERFPSLVQRD